MVYVDQLRHHPTIQDPKARRTSARWCHMTADSLTELHEMARHLGLRKTWFQPHDNLHKCHYDLTPQRRAQAVSAGAVEIDTRTRIRQLQQDGQWPTPSGLLTPQA